MAPKWGPWGERERFSRIGEEGSPSADVNNLLAIEDPVVPAADRVRNHAQQIDGTTATAR